MSILKNKYTREWDSSRKTAKITHTHENTDIKEYWYGQTSSYEAITATVMKKKKKKQIASQSQSTSIFIKHFLLKIHSWMTASNCQKNAAQLLFFHIATDTNNGPSWKRKILKSVNKLNISNKILTDKQIQKSLQWV